MAMLAEPKRRVKWTLNPRGNFWSDDDNKFGQKLMEKMGWSKGKGLGKDEQGRTDHVKVSVREDNKGVGYKGNDDEWIKHYDAFESVLANLNSANNSDDETKPIDSMEDSASGRTSLEVKSKKSRARVHYHKFTRGKDLSRYGEDDLACILGSKMSKAQKIEAEEAPQELAAEQEVEDEIGHTEHTHGVTTIKGGNIQEYFAKKMALLKKTENCNKTMNNSYSEIEENEDCERQSFGGFNSGIDVANTGLGWNQEQSENQGRKKKNVEYGKMDRNCCAEGALDREEEHTHIKKKRKRAKEILEIVPNKDDENGDINEDISYVSKKKKKKKNTDVDCELLVDNGQSGEMGKVPKKKKKKKNKNEDIHNEDQQGEMYNEVSLGRENHKELKINKKKKVKIPVEQELALQDNQEPIFTKKKRDKSQDINIKQDLNVIGLQDKEKEELGQSKKKKKKKKRDQDTKVVLEGE